MKKYLSILLIMILGFTFYVKADAGPPAVAQYKIIVTNKNGAACYDSEGKNKTGVIIPYGKEVSTWTEIYGNFLDVNYTGSNGEEISCYVQVKDVAAKDSTFSINNSDVEKITPVKAVILANGGLNLRKGPSTLFGRITTIKQGEVVTLKYKTGTYWYYTEYKGNKGWITGQSSYFGYEDDRIIYSYKNIDIYDIKNTDKKIGTIPKYTEVTDFLDLVYYHSDSLDEGGIYYVNYKGIKGVIREYIPFKVNGKVKLEKDVKSSNGKTLTKGNIYDYTIQLCEEADYNDSLEDRCTFYIPSIGGTIIINSDGYTTSDEKYVKKTKGFIGEGLYGEAKTIGVTPSPNASGEPNNVEPTVEPENPNNNEPTNNESKEGFKLSTEMIIICVMGAVILALTAYIIIKLANTNKKLAMVNEKLKKEDNDKVDTTVKEEKIENNNETNKEENEPQKKED